MHTNLIVDINNGVFRTRFGKLKTPGRNQRKDPYAKEFIFKELVDSIVRSAIEFKCDAILIACDSPNVWRKQVYDLYKVKDEEKDVYYQDCIDAADMCKRFFDQCTNSKVIQVPRAEADDVIAIFCQENPGTVKNIILSSDKDFIQLIDENTSLYSPQQKVFRETEDAKFDLFLKCIRGDQNDNIPSAYPRVRETKLKEAWNDPVALQNLFETVTKSGGKVYDLYQRNKQLIDLTQQPIDVKNAIKQEIYKTVPKRFSDFKVAKFFVENNLKEFSNMLNMRDKPLRGFVRHK